jgi:hypothetical protein
MIEGLMNANEAYLALGEGLGDGTEVNEEINIGEAAQNAVVAFAVSAAVETLMATGLTEEESATQLYYLLFDPENVSLTATEEDLGSIQDSFNETSEEFGALTNLLDAANLDLGSLGI